MSIAIGKNNSTLEVVGTQKSSPVKLKNISVANVFGDDGAEKALNKLNVNGNNPFGSEKVKDNEKPLKRRFYKKALQLF